mmetsp:Transcript_2125/g.4303  ORF Transcript_2125/g.4303 Transcript_2125/m.4303 type:complete len:174 (+) Transcript_2125:101-622(+)
MMQHHRNLVQSMARSSQITNIARQQQHRWSTSEAMMATACSAADVQLRPNEVREHFRSLAMEHAEKRAEATYSLSFHHHHQQQSKKDEPTEAWELDALLDARMRAQLQASQDQLKDSTMNSKPHHQNDPPKDSLSFDALAPALPDTTWLCWFNHVSKDARWNDDRHELASSMG